MKRHARVLAIDDGPHGRSDAHVGLVGVVAAGPSYIEGVLTGRAEVDGSDGTRAVARMVRRSRFRPLLRAVLLNGVFVGGFNLVDVERLARATGLPVVALVRRAPRPRLVRRALERAFSDGDRRWRRVEALMPRRLPRSPLWATVAGTTPAEAARLCLALGIRGHWPEPLRLAHVIASGFARGESRGRA